MLAEEGYNSGGDFLATISSMVVGTAAQILRAKMHPVVSTGIAVAGFGYTDASVLRMLDQNISIRRYE